MSSSSVEQRSRGKGPYLNVGYANTRFGDGFAFNPQYYFFGGNHFYGGVGLDIVYRGSEKNSSNKEIRKLCVDVEFLLGWSYTIGRLRPYITGGLGGFTNSDIKTEGTDIKKDTKTGFVFGVALGADFVVASHFVIGGQYRLQDFVDYGFTDTWTITFGWPL